MRGLGQVGLDRSLSHPHASTSKAVPTPRILHAPYRQFPGCPQAPGRGKRETAIERASHRPGFATPTAPSKDTPMTVAAHTVESPDYAAIKAKQNAAWASGDYARIGTTLQIVGESLAEAMERTHGSSVLNVAA